MAHILQVGSGSKLILKDGAAGRSLSTGPSFPVTDSGFTLTGSAVQLTVGAPDLSSPEQTILIPRSTNFWTRITSNITGKTAGAGMIVGYDGSTAVMAMMMSGLSNAWLMAPLNNINRALSPTVQNNGETINVDETFNIFWDLRDSVNMIFDEVGGFAVTGATYDMASVRQSTHIDRLGFFNEHSGGSTVISNITISDTDTR